MNYIASVTDFFKSPKWLNNLLLGGLCMLIPVVGPIVLMGWHVTGFWARRNPDDFATYPPFDFGNLGKYLERGVWPFLVMMLLPLILVPVMMVAMFTVLPTLIAAGTAGRGHEAAQGAMILWFMVFGLMFVLGNALIFFLIRPLLILSSITQDFASTFNWRRLQSFIALTWLEIIVCSLFLWLVAFVLAVSGIVALIIGMYFTLSVVHFVNAHLDWQLYHLYVARGGEPVPPSPKLRDTPPPLPPVLA